MLINPRMPADQAERLHSWLPVAEGLKAHVFVLTSGSTAASEADYKWVALSKGAVLAAASASNSHLAVTPSDVWLHCLPDFHVGGLGIRARALLGGNRVETIAWDAGEFTDTAKNAGATLSSLVPAQVHDLVALSLAAPPSVRAVLVGGGSLADDLYLRARELGWPLLRTYGMSETASQLATETLDDLGRSAVGEEVSYRVLPHLQAAANEQGRLMVRGGSLLSGYVSLGEDGRPAFWDPKDGDGWFLTEDLGQVENGQIRLEGRLKDRIKVGGEMVNMAVLRRTWESLLPSPEEANSSALCALPDDRLEAVVVLVTESGGADAQNAVDRFNAQVMPFERIRKQFAVERIPRSELGKVKWAELEALLQAQ